VLANGGWVRVLGFVGLLAAFLHLTLFRSDPTGTLKGIDWARHRGHTDHVAHIGETRIFPRLGLEMWRTPAAELFRRLTPAELAALPADVRAHTSVFPKDTHFVPGYPPDRPLVMNFAHVPRTYPPPVFLLGAPSAILYHYGLISFGASNRLFLGLLALSWFALVLACTAPWVELPPSLSRQLLTTAAVGYAWYWAMEGFYDVCAVALIAVALEAARRRQHGLACFTAGLGVFMHPRLLMLGPLYVLMLWGAARAFRSLGRRQQAAVVLGACFGVCAVVFSALIQRVAALHALVQPPNPVRLGAGPWASVIVYTVVVIIAAGLLLRQSARADAAVVLFGGLAFASQRYLAPWYWLPMLPWALAPAPTAEARPVPMSKTAALSRVAMVGLFFLASNAPRW